MHTALLCSFQEGKKGYTMGCHFTDSSESAGAVNVTYKMAELASGLRCFVNYRKIKGT